MKDLNDGAKAPWNACVYTASEFNASHRFRPLLIDRLGRPDVGSGNRLILTAPLLEGAYVPASPPWTALEDLPLFDWMIRNSATKRETGMPALNEGGDDAVTH